jgi:hypothetical protein
MCNRQNLCLVSLLAVAAAAATQQQGTLFPPVSWPQISVCIWQAYVVLRQGDHEPRGVLWGWMSACAMLCFLAYDSSFRSWGKCSTAVSASCRTTNKSSKQLSSGKRLPPVLHQGQESMWPSAVAVPFTPAHALSVPLTLLQPAHTLQEMCTSSVGHRCSTAHAAFAGTWLAGQKHSSCGTLCSQQRWVYSG